MKRPHSSWIRFLGHGVRAAALLLALAAGSAGPARAQRLPPDPVEALRQTLKRDRDVTGTEAIRARERTLQERARAVRSVGDLGRALLLEDWSYAYLETKVQDVDQKVFAGLADRFARDIREALRPGGDPLRARAAATLVGEMAAAAQAPGARMSPLEGRLAELTPALARLTATTSEPPEVRVAALLALGKIAPRASEGLGAVDRVLRNGPVAGRRAAAAALIDLIRVPSQAAELTTTIPAAKTGTRQPLAPPPPGELSARVVPVAALGLDDPDAEVRRLSLEAVHEAALNLRELAIPLSVPPDVALPEGLRPEPTAGGEPTAGMQDLMRALAAAAPKVAQLTQGQAPDVRLLALRTLEEMGYARQRMGPRRAPAAPAKPPMTPPAKTEAPTPAAPLVRVALAADAPRDTVLRGLERSLADVTAAVADPDVRVRLAAIDVLEMLGPNALPAAPALIRALADVDPFVRWAAARTLGKMVPPEAERVSPALVEAVPGLARLLCDPDLDLRLAAAQALTNFGPDAAGAVEALAKAVGNGDVEARVAAIGALEAIGDQAAPAIPAVIQALGQEDPRLLTAAARLLGRFGAEAARGNLPEVKAQLQQAIAPLRALLNSDDAGVRSAASDALLNIVGP